MISELDCVTLISDLPGDKLSSGDKGTVVYVHRDREAFEVEFFTTAGETITIATVSAVQLRPIHPKTAAKPDLTTCSTV